MATPDDEDDVNPFAAPESDLVSRDKDDYVDDGERGHAVIDAGEVISASWEIFKSNFGMAVGGVFVGGILINLCGLPQNILNAIGDVLDAQGDHDTARILHVVSILFLPVALGGQFFFQAGQARLMLNLAQGKNAQLGDLFTGAPFFWRMLGSSLLFGLMVGFGFIACIIPGLILFLMFVSYSYALVDQNSPGIQCLTVARNASKDNLVALLVILFAALGINILGLLALCIGLLATVPLTTLFFAVAYCKMTGQRTAERM